MNDLVERLRLWITTTTTHQHLLKLPESKREDRRTGERARYKGLTREAYRATSLAKAPHNVRMHVYTCTCTCTCTWKLCAWKRIPLTTRPRVVGYHQSIRRLMIKYSSIDTCRIMRILYQVHVQHVTCTTMVASCTCSIDRNYYSLPSSCSR